MRKFSVIFMAAAVSFGLISCGGGGKSSADDPDIKSYTVTWNYNYSGAPDPVQESVQSGNLLTAPETVPEREGSYFTEKWYTEASCETEWDFASDTVTSDTVLYAGWKYKPYLVFRSTEPFSLSAGKKWDGSIDWSVDTEEWNTDWDGSSVEAVKSSVNDYYYLYVRGKNKKITGSELGSWTITPEESSTVECYGSVMVLLDSTNPDSVTLVDGEGDNEGKENEGCFEYLFHSCSCLSLPPELPAVTLSDSCYMCMFTDCTSLETAPVLPAETLAGRCYCSMFTGCTALTKAPELCAQTMAYRCFSGMFDGCKNLTTAPEMLPAKTLAEGCYNSMFEGCSALTTAPILPAEELASECYSRMFYGCKNLTTAPEMLPAKTLAEGCYKSMFEGCSALTTAPILPAEELASKCYRRMFYGCSSLNISEVSGTNSIFTVPEYGSECDKPVVNMFYGTAGSFYTEENAGTPEVNKTYFWN